MTDSEKPFDRNGRCHPACRGKTGLQDRVGNFPEDVQLAGVLEELHEEKFVTEDGNNDVTNSERKEQPVEAVFHLAKHKEREDVSDDTDDTDEGNVDLTETVNCKDQRMVRKVLATVFKRGVHLCVFENCPGLIS